MSALYMGFLSGASACAATRAPGCSHHEVGHSAASQCHACGEGDSLDRRSTSNASPSISTEASALLRTSSTRLSRQSMLSWAAMQHHGDDDGDDAAAEHAAGGGTVVVHEHSIFAYVSLRACTAFLTSFNCWSSAALCDVLQAGAQCCSMPNRMRCGADCIEQAHTIARRDRLWMLYPWCRCTASS